MRFQLGRAWAAAMRTARRRRLRRSASVAGSTSSAIGSLWPHHTNTDGWWASRSTASRAWRRACLADRAAVAPLQRQVLPQQHAGLVGRVVELGPADVGVHPQEVEPGVAGQGDVAGDLGRLGLGQRHAGRALVGALEEEPLAVDRGDPVAELRPCAGRAASGARRSARPSVGRAPRRARRRAAGRRGRGATRAAGRARRPSTRRGSRRRPAAGCGATSTGSPRSPRGRDGGERGRPVGPRRCRARRAAITMARSSLTSPQRTRAWRMRTGPDCSRRTGRQMPPGFQSWSSRSQCWNTPVRLRLAVRSVGPGAGDLEGERVLAGRGQGLGDLEGVGEEVALGVAEVGAVEPDVAGVEDAVEHEPGPRGRRRSTSARARAERRRARRTWCGAAPGRRCRRRPGSIASGRARWPGPRPRRRRPGPGSRGGLPRRPARRHGPPGAREVDVGGHRRCNLPERPGDLGRDCGCAS